MAEPYLRWKDVVRPPDFDKDRVCECGNVGCGYLAGDWQCHECAADVPDQLT
jgi:hypothetical protein